MIPRHARDRGGMAASVVQQLCLCVSLMLFLSTTGVLARRMGGRMCKCLRQQFLESSAVCWQDDVPPQAYVRARVAAISSADGPGQKHLVKRTKHFAGRAS